MQSDAAHSAHSIHFRLTFIVVTRYKPCRVVQQCVMIRCSQLNNILLRHLQVADILLTSGERVHERLLGHGGRRCRRGGGGGRSRADGDAARRAGHSGLAGLRLLGLADLGVALGELEADGLGEVGVEADPLLQGGEESDRQWVASIEPEVYSLRTVGGHLI